MSKYAVHMTFGSKSMRSACASQCDFIPYWFYVRRHFYRLFTFHFCFFSSRFWVGWSRRCCCLHTQWICESPRNGTSERRDRVDTQKRQSNEWKRIDELQYTFRTRTTHILYTLRLARASNVPMIAAPMRNRWHKRKKNEKETKLLPYDACHKSLSFSLSLALCLSFASFPVARCCERIIFTATKHSHTYLLSVTLDFIDDRRDRMHKRMMSICH